MVVGGDGTLSCWAWNFTEQGKNRAAAAMDAARARFSQVIRLRREQDAALQKMHELSSGMLQIQEGFDREQGRNFDKFFGGVSEAALRKVFVCNLFW